jgi:hypothetical protein
MKDSELKDSNSSKWQESGEDCIMTDILTYKLHQVLLGLSS